MADKKYLDQAGVQYLWSKVSLQDYPNNDTLVAVLNAIDDTKADITYVDEKAEELTNNMKEYVDKSQLLNLIYPIGSVYISVSSTNPSLIFGGEWETIEDTFLLSAGSTYEAGSTGGEAEHVLSHSEMPSLAGEIVTHGAYTGTPIADVAGCFSKKRVVSSKYLSGSTGNSADSVSNIGFSNSGENKPHNNMPPYLVVYMWKRIQ